MIFDFTQRMWTVSLPHFPTIGVIKTRFIQIVSIITAIKVYLPHPNKSISGERMRYLKLSSTRKSALRSLFPSSHKNGKE